MKAHKNGRVNLAIFFLTLLIVTESGGKRTVVKKLVRIETFENCKDRPSTAEYLKKHNYISNVRIERVKLDQILNADYVVNRPVKQVPGDILMSKCESKDMSSCEHVLKMRYGICKSLQDKNQFYTPLIESIQPAMRCPLVKTVYSIKNGTFSSENMSQFITAIPGSADNFWSIKFSYVDENNAEAGCMHIVFKVYQVKVKQ